MWSISVPPGYSILLEFEHLGLENDSYCLFDRLTVSVGPHKPVGEFYILHLGSLSWLKENND